MKNPCRSLLSIYWDSLRPMKLITFIIYPLAALGMIWSKDAPDADAHLLFDVAPGWMWALMLLYVWVARGVGLFVWGGNKLTRTSTPMFGIFFWSMMLASNLQHPETLAFGTLYGVCALLEGWVLSRAWLEG